MLPRRMAASRRNALLVTAVALAATGLGACGTQTVELADDDPLRAGAVIFNERCAGCHTLSASGSQGGAFEIRDRERTDGPSFDARKETVDQVLYAIRNGGFSGAIMPENIITGPQAQLVAEFLAKHSGSESESEATQTSFGNN
jgi:mono/diheme cytochrome c family protein